MIVRQATLDELPDLSDLCLRSKAVWGYDQAFLEACRSELALRPDELATTRIAVAETDGGIAGVVQIKVMGTDAELLKLFIAPHGLRRGLGRTLFNWAAVEAKHMGATHLLIEADPDAAPFYRRLGAHDVGVAISQSIPGRTLPKLRFEITNV
ncbi:GNAT family N-acetyltransferase [Bradyrhizobium prioriisuperbiae]|uniref:GNAT family N-acetyltransferase n=1 Tax=Bradyrhizobium prioriisuperbiae TaxID=2854389 RepID=UPI0028E43C77|nr:GNAT family N-acetyltransferase [Bradyrhizobium prioritasuperba]